MTHDDKALFHYSSLDLFRIASYGVVTAWVPSIH